ncbi:MAG: hypothetical protein PVI30_09170 [Myxococcales bacterium]|jgi:hypothetical protein
MTDSWIDRCERALGGEAVDGVDRSDPRPPPVLDPAGRRALLAPFLAAFMWAAVVFREQLTTEPLDPMALLLRLLAVALTARTLVLGAMLLKRLRASLQRESHGLALCDEGLMLRTPRGDFPVPREDVVSIQEQGQWQNQSGRRWGDVYLVTRPDSGRLYLAIPPFFESSPGVLAEHLMRWRGAVQRPGDEDQDDAQEPAEREPAELASKVYDAAAAGERPPGTAVIPHGRGWLERGPYATMLLGAVVLDGYLRMPEAARAKAGVLALTVAIATLIIIPGFWYLATRIDIAPRKGLSLVLTPAEMLMRTRAGIHRVRWSQIERLEISSRAIWSILKGQHEARALVVHRKHDDTISYVEAFLGAPAEVILGLCDAYRKGILP